MSPVILRFCLAPLLIQIFCRYGDHLYGKGDYEGAMSCYLKTVGTVQASYVIRKVSSDFHAVSACTEPEFRSSSTHNDSLTSPHTYKSYTLANLQIAILRLSSSTATRNSPMTKPSPDSFTLPLAHHLQLDVTQMVKKSMPLHSISKPQFVSFDKLPTSLTRFGLLNDIDFIRSTYGYQLRILPTSSELWSMLAISRRATRPKRGRKRKEV